VLTYLIVLMFWGVLLKVSHNLVFREPQHQISWGQGMMVAAMLILVLVGVVVLMVVLAIALPPLKDTWPIVVLFNVLLFLAGTAVIRRMMGELFWKHAAAIMAIAVAMHWCVSWVLGLFLSAD
jgi:hypothetical protein